MHETRRSHDRLIVHIGMHKTGTSSIQESLAANLLDNKFSYLQFGRPNGSLAVNLAYGRLDAFRPNAPDFAPEKRLLARRKGMALITNALNRLHADTGIISAESITTLRTSELPFFFDLLRRYRNDVRAVAYLRKPKAYTQSAYQEKLKSFFVPLSGVTQVIRYRTVFSRFDKILGQDNVYLWLYDPKTLHRGCVVQDFCNRCGIRFRPSDVIRTNEGLSAPATQLLYIYRKHCPKFRQIDKKIIEVLSQLQGRKLQFHSTLIAKMMRINNDELGWASERVGADMSEDYTQDDGFAIRSEEDMVALPPETVDWLAQRCGRRSSLLSQDMTAVADTVASLGISTDAKNALRSSTDRECHALPQAP